MPVSFAQMWKNFGLDVSAKPDPAMIVPLGGDNVIKVFGAPDMSLFEDRGILEIKKLDSSARCSTPVDGCLPSDLATGSTETGWRVRLVPLFVTVDWTQPLTRDMNFGRFPVLVYSLNADKAAAGRDFVGGLPQKHREVASRLAFGR
jgi:hypothetical protein